VSPANTDAKRVIKVWLHWAETQETSVITGFSYMTARIWLASTVENCLGTKIDGED
jgi:hypothetical protein